MLCGEYATGVAAEAAALLEPPVSPPARLTLAYDAGITALVDSLAAADAASERGEYAEVLGLVDAHSHAFGARADLAFRALCVEGWARLYVGDVAEAERLLIRARAIAERPEFTDADRAEAVFRLGCCRFKAASASAAATLLTLALELAERSSVPCDALRVRILDWRSRCYQRQRDFDAAQADVDRAIELAEALADDRLTAHAYFQASLVAERRKQWLLARFYAEQACARYEAIGDALSLARILNNLGGITFLLGDADAAAALLKRAYALALEVESTADAAQVISSLAQVHLRTGKPALAEEQARLALDLLGGRVDFRDEIGNVQLVLAGALLEQERFDDALAMAEAADGTFEQLGATSQRAAAWVAAGDVARRRGECDRAAELYRQAAEALQDFHF